MRRWVLIAIVVSFVTACAGKDAVMQSDSGIYCRTHARQTGATQSPDEETLFRDCMHIKGTHEVEVK